MKYCRKTLREITQSLNKLDMEVRMALEQREGLQMSMGTTHIRISDKNYKKLTGLGKKNESYDDIITRLIELWEHHNHHRHGGNQ
jgi:hypothetical protein